MEKGSRGLSCRAAICGIVALLSAAAFACSLAAEFSKVKGKDMKVDGSLCSLPRSSAFELGVAAIVFLFVVQLVGTTTAVTAAGAAKPRKSSATRGRVAFVALLVLSWVSFAVAVILLATAASMNHGQRYGRGWMDGDCYVARNGVFGGAAALVVVTALITLGLAFATEPSSSSSASSTSVAAGAAVRGPRRRHAPPHRPHAERSISTRNNLAGDRSNDAAGWTEARRTNRRNGWWAASFVPQKAAPRGCTFFGWRGNRKWKAAAEDRTDGTVADDAGYTGRLDI